MHSLGSSWALGHSEILASGKVVLKAFFVAVSIAGVAAAVFAAGVYGMPEIAEVEDRSCVTCHTALGRAELNDAGQYYEQHRTLEGYPGELPSRLKVTSNF